MSEINIPTDNDALNLSEDSSDEELKVTNNKVINQESPQGNQPDNKVSVNEPTINTAYDFSKIMKLQEDLIVARERFNSCVASFEDQEIFEETAGTSGVIKDNTSLDDCSVAELLERGERNNSKANQNKSESEDESCMKPLEITIPQTLTDRDLRRQKNREAALTKHLNQVLREKQAILHKVHLLCLLAHGNYVNSLVSNEMLYGRALSFLPVELSPPLKVTVSYIQRLLHWFGKTFSQKKHKKTGILSLEKLEQTFTNLKPCSVRDSVILFVSLLRGLGLCARIVINFNPVPLKPKKARWSSGETTPRYTDVEKNVQVKKLSGAKGKSFTQSKMNPSTKGGFEGAKASKGKIPKLGGSLWNESSDSSSEEDHVEDNQTHMKSVVDYWAEVYIENDDRWVTADLFSQKVDCSSEVANRCTQPILYIVAWKNDKSLKDVTRRYTVTWTGKNNRVDQQWWTQTLAPFISKNHGMDLFEDEQLDETVQLQPMPINVNEYKNHPLYALQRHLLKYEAIYPPDAAPLGYVKGEPVYSRFCVHELCSREKWLQQGKSVRLGEVGYKKVKSRAKVDKYSGTLVTDKPLELFGSWQVEDYIPLPAVDGKVPRNEYGNVELYKPSMLPAGTVHLQVPGLQKIAQKLNIDCAPAVIGWQHHSGVSHPVVDGVVVCKEYEDILLDAWNAEIDNYEKRSTMKRRLRAKKNWLKLYKALRIKVHLKKKYNFGDTNENEPQPKIKKK